MSTESMDRVRRAFEEWRKKKGTGRGHAPAELRRMALSIYRQHGEKATCEGLGVSSSALWRWKQTDSPPPSTRSKPKAKKGRVPVAKVSFVELPQPGESPASLAPLTVEWRRSDGAAMRLDGRALTLEHIGQLASSFLEPTASHGGKAT